MEACATLAAAQGSYRAQLRGVVSDATGAVISNANVTITDAGTNISRAAHTDEKGEYYFTGLRPSTYIVKVQIPGFRAEERTGVVLAVDQEATLNFTLRPASVSEKVDVTTTAPLLDTQNATLGTDITSEYVKQIPLINRDFFGLTFLAGGVTEVAGSGTQDNYPSGTNFVSNGQRNATAEVRIDGALISAPEQGEGGNSNVYYEPLIESVQEFKVENNSFSAEFGNNGGTVVNMVLKSGTNAFHGSAWYFLQRSQMNARDFFNPSNPIPNQMASATREAFHSVGRSGRTAHSSSSILKRFASTMASTVSRLCQPWLNELAISRRRQLRFTTRPRKLAGIHVRFRGRPSSTTARRM